MYVYWPASATPMVFVYKGAGKKLREDADACERLCAKKNRDLQWCLNRNSFQLAKCTSHRSAQCLYCISYRLDLLLSSITLRSVVTYNCSASSLVLVYLPGEGLLQVWKDCCERANQMDQAVKESSKAT